MLRPRALGAPADFFFHQTTSKEFAQRAASCKQRVLKLLGQFQVSPTCVSLSPSALQPGGPSICLRHRSYTPVATCARVWGRSVSLRGAVRRGSRARRARRRRMNTRCWMLSR
jgi:hypothetical protein